MDLQLFITMADIISTNMTEDIFYTNKQTQESRFWLTQHTYTSDNIYTLRTQP